MERHEAVFTKMDKNGDGVLDEAERLDQRQGRLGRDDGAQCNNRLQPLKMEKEPGSDTGLFAFFAWRRLPASPQQPQPEPPAAAPARGAAHQLPHPLMMRKVVGHPHLPAGGQIPDSSLWVGKVSPFFAHPWLSCSALPERRATVSTFSPSCQSCSTVGW